ncbi:MAG: succinate dehydrogenase cytochrome b subunit [Deltaproteobacteria bacterium]|nr:MAG: succinate dehydrogenase cytochrome b subunit [Deltaproteobacteria bacterium]
MGYLSLKKFNNMIGIKFGVALSGIILFLFLIVHVIGNLQVFLGKETFNAYARTLHSYPMLVFAARVFIGFIFLMHIFLVLVYYLRLPRGARYNTYRYKVASVETAAFSKITFYTGVFVFVFVIAHILHFPMHSQDDLYLLVVQSFKNEFISGLYCIGIWFLYLHLAHALRSLPQTLGVAHFDDRGILKKIGSSLAILICCFFILIPISILSGLIK